MAKGNIDIAWFKSEELLDSCILTTAMFFLWIAGSLAVYFKIEGKS